MGMRRKLESLGINPGPGDPLGLGLGLGGAARRRDVKATGQVLHRDLKPENSECGMFLSDGLLALSSTWNDRSRVGGTKVADRVTLCVFPRTVFLDEQDNIKLGDFGLSKNLAAGAFTQTYVGVGHFFLPADLITRRSWGTWFRLHFTCRQRS